MEEFYYDSCGAGRIHVSRWAPKEEPKGIVQIVHGIAEHTERYQHFAEFLNSLGYLVVAEDHMGHGKSIGANGITGYFHKGWFSAVDDTYHLLEITREEYPALPYILLGHSMGSFICRSILIRYPRSGISGCILCGTGWIPHLAIQGGLAACKTVCSTQGETLPSPKLQSVMFAGYNRKVECRRTPFDWLCRDEKQVDLYMADPFCGFYVTAGLCRDMLTGIQFNQESANLQAMRKDLPVFFISGTDDPVGNFGTGVQKTACCFTQSGMQNVSLKLYPLCRHELLNELNRQEVYNDIRKWIDNLKCASI